MDLSPQIDGRDLSALRFAGFLGHQYVVVTDGVAGRSCSAEVNTLDQAERYARRNESGNPFIYRQIKRGVWERSGRPMCSASGANPSSISK
jgi:hypothetical protein